jgi:hypothetical protein
VTVVLPVFLLAIWTTHLSSQNHENYIQNTGFQAVKIRNRITFKL